MIETVSLDVGNPTRSKPTADELAAALQQATIDDADDILSSSWAEIENFSGRLFGARAAVHVFRMIAGSETPAFPGYRPVAEAVTLRRWHAGAYASATVDYQPDGILRGLARDTIYEATASNLGNLGSASPPKNVLQAVVRLAAWRASHRGGLFLPLADGPQLAGYTATDAIRRSGAAELLQPHMHFGGH